MCHKYILQRRFNQSTIKGESFAISLNYFTYIFLDILPLYLRATFYNSRQQPYGLVITRPVETQETFLENAIASSGADARGFPVRADTHVNATACSL